jgi:leukotriene-A4 hydrolase
VKSSYSAAVRVPAELTALMSAVPSDTPPEIPVSSGSSSTDGIGSSQPAAPVAVHAGVPHLSDVEVPPGREKMVYYFLQKVPIPSYLIALAVGQLESRELSDRY